jgi:alkanesulfonate monooxygenase SsuD/methylene tetrahydromethanopterin reductase-like flavin-dependent oxidoreductase (luciferase family)
MSCTPMPFARGGISVGIHPTASGRAREAIEQLFAQARAADRSGFDGVTVSEHHGGGGGGGYLPNPLAAAGWLIPDLARAWAAPAPLLISLRSPNLVVEEIAWLAARFPGRIGLCVGPGFAPLDFDVAEVPLAERQRRYRSGLTRLAEALAGAAPDQLHGDLAVAALAPGSVPLVATLGGPIGAANAGRAGAGAMIDSFASVEKARTLFDRYTEAGGKGPRVLCRRAWLGAPDPGRMESLARSYGSLGSGSAIGAPQADFVATPDPEEMAGILAQSVREANADALLLRFYFQGVTEADMEEQISRTGSEALPHLRRLLPAQ